MSFKKQCFHIKTPEENDSLKRSPLFFDSHGYRFALQGQQKKIIQFTDMVYSSSIPDTAKLVRSARRYNSK